MNSKKWSEEAVATLLETVGEDRPVTPDAVVAATNALSGDIEYTTNSVASKLRKMGIEVESTAKAKQSTFTDLEGAELEALLSSNEPGTYTYKSLAEAFMMGKFSAKQVQGKVLALELTQLIKPADKVAVVNKYTEQEEETFISMANSGSFIEDIAATLGKTTASVRGKALSLTSKGAISKIPVQKNCASKSQCDPLEVLGDDIYDMTVAEISEALDGKTERGVKTMLTRRGITVLDYDGAAKKAKANARVTEEQEVD